MAHEQKWQREQESAMNNTSNQRGSGETFVGKH
jgi:hypothetical protein